MKVLFNHINNYGLLTKIFLVMFISMMVITLTIILSTVKVSGNLFIETFTITNSKILSQIQKGVDEFNYSIMNTVNAVEQNGSIKKILTESEGSSLEVSRSYYNMNEQIKRVERHLANYDTGMTIVGKNRREFSTNHIYWPITSDELRRHPITFSVLDRPRRLAYYYDDRHVDELKVPAIVASKALIDRVSNEVYGVIYIGMKEFDFRQLYESYTSEGNDIVMINGDGIIVSSNQEALIGKQEVKLLNQAREIERLGLNYKNIKFVERKKIMLATYLPALDLYLINLIDYKNLMSQIIDKNSIVITGVVITILTLLIFYIISRRLTSSLTSLVDQINTIGKYKFDHYIEVSGSYETKQVANAFNMMLDELHVYIQELLVTQKKQRNAELEALQQQINPHFLYNTMASIKIIINQGNKEKATEMINKLISLLQNTIGNISETNTVAEEIEIMKDYTFINQSRYGERIRVNFYVTPEVLAYELPKLVIQPFIENAFFHAFNNKSSGVIRIMIGRDGDNLVCEVVDNGDGMENEYEEIMPSDKKKRKLFSGIGVKNVNERIKLLYGSAYGVEISSEIGRGTKVKIRLPLISQ